MNGLDMPHFISRQTTKIALPLERHSRVLRPEQVMLKTGNTYLDIGALCYAVRSSKPRTAGRPAEVQTSSLIKQRPKQILQLIKALSALVSDGGKSIYTVRRYAYQINLFVNWADSNDLKDCLAGGEATRGAFRAWAGETYESYQHRKLNEKNHNTRLLYVSQILEAATGIEYLMQGVRKVKPKPNPNGGTEPLAVHDFAHAVALNQCLFDGLCDLVLNQRPFPFKLDLPKSLGWAENHLWLFPTSFWLLPPQLRQASIREELGANASWIYDYENGRLATVDEIETRYKGKSKGEQRHAAARSIKRASSRLAKANADPQNVWRFTLAMVALRAFMFLFYCNTGGNAQVVRDLETDDRIDADVQNQKFRGLKWRAGGKEITFVAPVTFMPRLRRFMELRKFLLQGRNTPYLFFSCGNRNNAPPAKIGMGAIYQHYRNLLIKLDPHLPKMSPRTLRASVDDYYLRFHDSVIAAAVMGHTVETEQRKYGRGSANDQHEELSLFMSAVSESARRQRVVPTTITLSDTRPLEGGGHCDAFGYPEALTVQGPVTPDCKDAQGCLFCSRRVLIAGEEDARKLASAVYVMEQLILGPMHEAALRPLISKCAQDLEKIASFPNCRVIVEKVRKDVYENENLTLFWSDKFQLFLELGVLS